MCLFWVSTSDKKIVKICCFAVFCEFFNFTFNFAMLHSWTTACLFVPQIVTLAGYTVLSGNLVNSGQFYNKWQKSSYPASLVKLISIVSIIIVTFLQNATI